MKAWQHTIISGGGSGLGLGLAERLLSRGGNVTILDLSLGDEARQKLQQAAASAGGEWRMAKTDLAEESQVNQAVDQAISHFGTPDLCINSAGILINRTLAETSSDDFNKVLRVNVTGSFNFARATLRYLQPGGRLAMIASIAGLVSNYGYSAYGTSKFGVIGLATTLRYEYSPLGIGITCVCPPEVNTPMVNTERSPGNASPISLALKDLVGALEPDPACDAILRGIDAGKWMVIPGARAKLAAAFARHCPGGFHALMESNIRKLMHRQTPTALARGNTKRG
jgi:3-dehydrosphinganine reductase